MTIKYDTVIIFGPTGATGSAAAAEAAKRGAKVWLAMRDISKSIKTLDESAGKFERIQADLSDPSSVKAAVQKSGAKAAYTYQIHGTSDAMKATINAMKEGGIEYVVFLSSFTIFPDEDIRKVTPDRLIPYAHSSIEVTIEDAGLALTALRPGSFAYNTFNQNVDRSVEPWKATLAASDKAKGDGIVPRDIGRVGGACLVDRPNDGPKEVIYLFGPKILTRVEQLEIAKRITGKEIDIALVGEEEYIQALVKNGIPEFVGRYLGKADRGTLNDQYYGNRLHGEGVNNVQKYSGVEATTFEQFCKEYLL
jgi:uncharacterized protein YbjT (DUF2867 family)